MGVTVSLVTSLPYENTSFAPVIADSDAPPYTSYFGPGAGGTIKNLNLNTNVVSGIVGAQLRSAGTTISCGYARDQYILRVFTAQTYHDVWVKVLSCNGAPANWSFYRVSAARALNALQNISARAYVWTGQDVLINGFYVSGNDSKTVLIRGIGPSLAAYGIANTLQDPYLELRDAWGNVVAWNNNWQDSQGSQISATGAAPSDWRESAILATLSAGSYTATLSGVNYSYGVGVCELYDMNPGANSQIVNLSTRAYVDTGNDVLIAGVIVGATNATGMRAIVRGIGPTLGNFGIQYALQDPTLELYDGNGTLLASNNDWQDTQGAEIQGTGVAPTDSRESAIVRYFSAGNYTAILRGLNNTVGVGVVDVYKL